MVLSWSTQFEKLQSKVVEAMSKVAIASLEHEKAAIYYDNCMLTNVCFRCGIIELYKKEENRLKLREAPLPSKLDFNVNFPREVMYVLKEMLRLGLFLPSVMIETQRLALL